MDPAGVVETRRSLLEDPAANTIYHQGTFIENGDYVDSLPPDVMAMVHAIQQMGPDPERPRFCSHQSSAFMKKYRETRSMVDLEMAVSLGAMATKYTESQDPYLYLCIYDFATALKAKWERVQDTHILKEVIYYFQKIPELLREGDNLLFTILLETLQLSETIFQQEPTRVNYEAVISASRKAFPVADSRTGTLMLTNEGEFILGNGAAYATGPTTALSEAINVQLQAVERIPTVESPMAGIIQRNAGRAFASRFEITLQDTDFKEAVFHYEEAFKFIQKGTSRYFSRFVRELGEVYENRYLVNGDLSEADKAIELYRSLDQDDLENELALLHRANIERQRALNLGTSNRKEALEGLESARGLLSRFLRALPSTPDSRDWYHFLTADIHYAAFILKGEIANLEKSIESAKEAVDKTSERNMWVPLHFLGGRLLERFEFSGQDSGLADAKQALERALAKTSAASIPRARCTYELGKTLQKQYDMTREKALLEKAISRYSEAAPLFSGTERAAVYIDLGNSFVALYSYTGDTENLTRAITNFEEADAKFAQVQVVGTDTRRTAVDVGLGTALLRRYQHLQSRDDLLQAMKYFRLSLVNIDEWHPRFADRVSNLSATLQLRFLLEGSVKYLKEAEKLLQRAFKSPSSMKIHTKISLETQMGNLFHRLYQTTEKAAGTSTNLDLAIFHYKGALAVLGGDPFDKAITELDLATAMREKAGITLDPDDYRIAADEFVVASRLLPENHAFQWTIRWNKAYISYDKFRYKIGESPEENGTDSIQEFGLVANNTQVDPRHRVQAARMAGILSYQLVADKQEAKKFMSMAVGFIPEALAFTSNRAEQLRILKDQLGGLPSDAAACSLASNDTVPATIQLLENARGFLWKGLLDETSDVESLRKRRQPLADELEEIRRDRSQNQTLGNSVRTNIVSLMSKDSLDLQEPQPIERYQGILDKIRAESGLENFLRVPDDLPDLHSMAEYGPVVYVNSCSFWSNEYRSDALIITKDTIFSLKLPGFKFESIQENRARLQRAIERLKDNAVEANRDYETVMTWLWKTVAEPVLDSIDFAPYNLPMNVKPRLFWVSTGWVPTLPIHAAEDFSTAAEDGGHSVVDRVISSYIPSIRVLSHLRGRARELEKSNTTSSKPILIVGMPTTPGADDLPNVQLETETVQKAIDSHGSTETMMNKTSSDIRRKLKECGMVHFACHAFADSGDPSKSMLQLEDWKSNPLNVRALIQTEMKACSLAYISACETAMSKNLFLLEEGIHIAGGFHMAGVPHTISALWPISDKASVNVAEQFYRKLKGKDGRLQFDKAAEALRSATIEMRGRGWMPIFLGAYIHSGP